MIRRGFFYNFLALNIDLKHKQALKTLTFTRNIEFERVCFTLERKICFLRPP